MCTPELKERYINFYTDFAFKKLFGTEVNKDLLISFLNSLFDGVEVIKDLKYLNVEHLGAAAAERKAVFDVYCENEKGEKFLIEMQKAELITILDKWLYAMKNLGSLMERPKALVDGVFQRFFEQAEIANFTPQELSDYRESQKDYWDLFSVVETAEKKGREEERIIQEQKQEEERVANILRMRAMNFSDSDIAKILNLDVEYVRSK